MGKARRWFGWTLGVLAALTLVVATPQHLVDFDEAAGPAAGPAAELSVHGHAHTLIDHGQPGHACAGHCAAHVMADATAAVVLVPPSRQALTWASAEDLGTRVRGRALLDRPPKA